MNWGIKKSYRLLAIALLAIMFVSTSQPAHAQSSVTVPGQVGIDQCPIGFQHSVGIEARIGTGIFTICYAPPTAEELLQREQDRDFQSRIQTAQDLALTESEAYNRANPGLQKCIQWGPIVHANGVTTSSGGVCANPIEASQPTPSQPAPSVIDETVLPTPVTPQPSGQPFYVFVAGQVAASDCPAGFQAANGIVVNATTHQVQTQCWSPAAWSAWIIGGQTWATFESSGGAVDVQAEINRRAAVVNLKARALASAQQAAEQTPGVRRCSAWSGYGESGSECAYSFISPTQQTQVPSNQPLAAPDQSAPDAQPVSFTPQQVKVLAAVNKIRTVTTGKTVVLPLGSQIRYLSLTPKVCALSTNKIKKLATGTCKISVKITDKSSISLSVIKKITFKK